MAWPAAMSGGPEQRRSPIMSASSTRARIAPHPSTYPSRTRRAPASRAVEQSLTVTARQSAAADARTDITRALVERAARISYDDLPTDVVASVKRVLLNTLAVAWAAGDAPGVNAARALALRGGAGHASLWGHRATRREPSAAAFFNGALAAALDFDSLAGSARADITVAPAALAVAEQNRRSGRELITALALGNELVMRLAAATRSTRGWSRTSVSGVFGAALAAARLSRLDETRTLHALGIALSHAAGTQQGEVEQRLTHRLQPALAARSGVVSAELAGLGVTGPEAPLEGRYGLFALFEEGSPETVLEDFGRHYLLTGTALKRFPACLCSHAALAATLDLVARHGIGAEHVAAGEVIVTPYMNRLVGGPFAPEANPQVTGQFNVRYAVATVLLRGRFGLADIEPAAVLDPAVRPLADRLAVRVDENESGLFAPAEVVLHLRDGRRLACRVDVLPGSSAAPLGEDQVRAKLVAAFGYGPTALREERALAFIDRIQRLEGVDDISALLAQVH